MKSLLNFLIKYHVFFLFLMLELVSFTFIVRYNNFHRVNFINSSNTVSGKVYSSYYSVIEYFSLRKLNDLLANENAYLRGELLSYIHADLQQPIEQRSDTTINITSVSAKVINNSVNKPYNYITLNRGSKHGIKPDMGVIDHNGVVGVIINVSENYSTALSVLNSRWSINAKLALTNYFGPLRWEGKNPYTAILDEIPYHVVIAENEEVVTSGFSSIFPEGVLIGTVLKTELTEGASFQKVWVQLSTDFKKLNYVEVVENVNKLEQLDLEKKISNE